MIKNSEFTHLHLHTEYSLLDGMGTAEDYFKRGSEVGFKELAITDHGNIDGAVKWQKAATKYGMKPIFGIEFYIVRNLDNKDKKTEKRFHAIALAKNERGWKSIQKMSSIANIHGFYYRPRIDYNLLLENLDGVIITTACCSTFLMDEAGLEVGKKLHEKLGDDFYLEIMPFSGFEPQAKCNNFIYDLHKNWGAKLVATNDCHYVSNGDEHYQDVLLAAQRKAVMSDPSRWKFEANGLYLRSASQMVTEFRKQGILERYIYEEALRNTKEIADKCTHSVDKLEINLPTIYQVVDDTPEQFLLKLIRNGLKEKLPNLDEETLKKYRNRYMKEFKVIKKLGFVKYFLIVWDLVSWSKENGISVGPGRGSVGGSLIAYLIGITRLDPIKYGLLFERFISEERNDLPDIDIDFPDNKREEVKGHLADMYGKENIAEISTFLKMKTRAVLKDVGRVYEIDWKEINIVNKEVNASIVDPKFTLDDVMALGVGKRFQKKYPHVVEAAKALEGQIKSGGRHAAGIVISDVPLTDGGKGVIVKRSQKFVVNWDKKDCEYNGLLKLDVLGLSNLSILDYAFELVRELRGENVSYNDIDNDLDNPRVYNEFENGNCEGVFQFNTPGMTRLSREIGINDFRLIAVANALYRPAPITSGLTEEFKKRHHKESDWNYEHEDLRPILEQTYGIIAYQEQIMLAVKILSGMSLLESDKVRKALDKNDPKLYNPFRKKFINGCIKNHPDIDRKRAKELWNYVKSFGGYCFNKAHAYGYAMLAYYCMWAKVKYPAEFMTACLTYGSDKKKDDYIEEAHRLGLKIILPKIMNSFAFKWATDGKHIYMPFVALKGIGEKSAIKIEQGIRGNLSEEPRDIFKGKILNVLDDAHAFTEDCPEYPDEVLGFDVNGFNMRQIVENTKKFCRRV